MTFLINHSSLQRPQPMFTLLVAAAAAFCTITCTMATATFSSLSSLSSLSVSSLPRLQQSTEQTAPQQQPRTRRRGGSVVGNLKRSSITAASANTNTNQVEEGYLQSCRDRKLQQQVSAATTLPWGDVNVVALTDVHSWVAGHGEKEPDFDADYGDVLSFYQRLKHYSLQQGYDLWFVVNGDWIDGTGLAMDGDPSHLIPLLEKMPWDVLNIGNHELYRQRVIEYMTRPGGFVEWWGDKYLSSNIVYSGKYDPTESNLPIGNPYRFLKGTHHTVLCFGFLYDMKNNDETVVVNEVRSVVQESWFTDALREQQQNLDAVLVLAHMDVKDDLVTVILQAVRAILGNDMPVQFITGHTHRRDYYQPDVLSASFEGGRYLDTIGFVSFPAKGHVAAPVPAVVDGAGGNRTLADNNTLLAMNGRGVLQRTTQTTNQTIVGNATTPATNSSSSPVGVGANTTSTPAPVASSAPAPSPSILFKHTYIDASVAALAGVLGFKDSSLLATEDGIALSRFIFRAQEELGLHEVIGCVKKSYFANRSLAEDGTVGDSLWELFRQHVVPFTFHGNEVVLMDKGSWRYDLLNGDVTVDNIIQVSPFNESLYMWRNLPSGAIQAAVDKLNNDSAVESAKFLQPLPMYILAPARPPFEPRGGSYDLITDAFHVATIQGALNNVFSQKPTTATSNVDSNSSVSVDDDVTTLMGNQLTNETQITVGNPTETKESNPPPVFLAPVVVVNGTITTTSIWMDWIQSDPLCKTAKKGSHTKHKTGTGDGKDKKSNNNKGTLQHRPGFDQEKLDKQDVIRLCFVIIAAVIVVAVLSILVYDRGNKWKLECAMRDAATASAIREYEEEGSHGEFVQQSTRRRRRRRKHELVATADLDNDDDDDDGHFHHHHDPIEIHPNGSYDDQPGKVNNDHPDMINMDDHFANLDRAPNQTNGTFA